MAIAMNLQNLVIENLSAVLTDGSGQSWGHALWSWLRGLVIQLWQAWGGTRGRLSLFHLTLSVLLAAVIYWWTVAPKRHFELKKCLGYLFPKSIYTSRSAGLDCVMYLFNFAFSPSKFLFPGLSVYVVATAVVAYLSSHLGVAPWRLQSTTLSALILGGLTLLAFDFSTYWGHRWQHEVKFLWAFHRVHHSAEVLTPITLARVHPLASVLGALLDFVIVGVPMGVASYFLAPDVGPLAASATSMGFKILTALGANLRHSHVWFSFGPVLGRILVSPAMHQLHHSRENRHWDRNYGEFFAFWDVMFKSAYLPREKEEFGLGLNGETVQPHDTFLKMLYEPFVYIWKNCRPGRAPAANTG